MLPPICPVLLLPNAAECCCCLLLPNAAALLESDLTLK